MGTGYNVTVVQAAVRPVYKGMGLFRPECLRENLDRLCALVEQAVRDTDAKLVVFPEFCLQGYALKRSIADWERAGVLMPGPETAALAAVARGTGATIAGAAVERIPDFPDRYFISGFVIAPDGIMPEDQLKLVYRKCYGLGGKTRPGDIHAPFVATFGRQALFPVIDTSLGKIGCAIAGDIAMPEIVRALALRGAELVLVPAAATYRTGAAASQALSAGSATVQRVRAWENALYLASANLGALVDGDESIGPERPPSLIIDYLGRVRARTADGATPESPMASARIDLEALRRHRADVRHNYLAHLQPALHAAEYAAATLCPLNGFVNHAPADEQDVLDFIAENWNGASQAPRR